MASPPSPTLLAGPELLGMFFNWGLQGVLIVQAYIYYICFPNDRTSLKLFVCGVLIYETVQTGLITADAFHNWVYGYGNIGALATFYNGWFSVPIMCGILSAGVQCFFAWRIWILARNYVLIGLIVFVAMAQMAAAIVSGVKLKLLPSASDEGTVTPFIDTWLAGSVLADVMIAIAMTYYLVRAKSGLRQPDAMINRLIQLVIETGSLTAIVATIDLILFTVKPETFLHMCPVLMLSKLYANTLFINFNNRILIRPGANQSSTIAVPAFPLPSTGDDRQLTSMKFGRNMNAPMPSDILSATDTYDLEETVKDQRTLSNKKGSSHSQSKIDADSYPEFAPFTEADPAPRAVKRYDIVNHPCVFFP
ncbi:uncharacterized protein FIBRA_07692 [Fibroporia radiculosa]|uniref:DUF6534 domain-containing protein n=1 Tax=Fibroporia radiculosa TaxID=599839 RepID=J4IBY5_9APHY|nr:uncharacterized protein FIBRA_07692 [Fibroporia radiculosa]CCM05471.1 predicted protein [Fibroporia radiculosa]